MAIEIRFNRLVVLKESVELYSSEPADVIASHLFQMYTEDEHLMGSSSMGHEVYDVSDRLRELGLEMNRDMVIVTRELTSSGVEWLELGGIDNTVVCWRSGFNPRPVTRHCFVNSEIPKDHSWIKELERFGIQTKTSHDEQGTPVFRCLRGEADVLLYEFKEDDWSNQHRLRSYPPSISRREFCKLDHDLMGDIQFALWRLSEM